MTINQLTAGIQVTQTWGNTAVPVTQIDFDSRQMVAGSLFVAVRGTQTDGHAYIDTAMAKGAVAIIAEQAPTAEQAAQVRCWVQVANSAGALGQVASAFFGHPSQQMRLVGVTGTNGKTTVATLMYQLFTALGYRAGLLSTVENRVGEEVISASHTTPDAVQINRLLAQMAGAECSYVFMEVSSHAIDQQRIAGLDFVGGVFTNMSHDHLD
jgi:UDP-N-acetylmuramoyl-L-alanyl-D-glutamate--2,6-diaminopimelate ligase